MRVKITGIGKCGIRVAYDFFAYTQDLPSAYEIRLSTHSGRLSKVFDAIGLGPGSIQKFRRVFKRLIDDFSTLYRIAELPEYVTIESDVLNNEILNSPRKLVHHEKDGSPREIQFDSHNHVLNNHVGGCNWHIISEQLARTWKKPPDEIFKSSGFNIFAITFSIAGGTGGGSAPIICERAKAARSEPGPCHFMGLGVLPKSDESYHNIDDVTAMADYEKFSTGRFVSSIYSYRVDSSMDSLWLFSNDMLRFLTMDGSERAVINEAGSEMKVNLSLVNYFLAESLTVLANSSSAITSADSNLDPQELNHFLDGCPFVSAFSQRKSGRLTDEPNMMREVKSLVFGALTNIKESPIGGIEGLSVPVHSDGLEGLTKLLSNESVDSKQFLADLDSYDAARGPIEFITTGRLIILHGQPTSSHLDRKSAYVQTICNATFPNSTQHPYFFRHEADVEFLLLFLVDPLIYPIVSAIYYYINQAWISNGQDMSGELNQMIRSKKFKEPSFISKIERFPRATYGGALDEIRGYSEQMDELSLKREDVISALRHLHEIRHRKRSVIDTKPDFGLS